MYLFGTKFKAKILILAERTFSIYSFWVSPIRMMVRSSSICCIMSMAAGPIDEIQLADEAKSIRLLSEVKTQFAIRTPFVKFLASKFKMGCSLIIVLVKVSVNFFSCETVENVLVAIILPSTYTESLSKKSIQEESIKISLLLEVEMTRLKKEQFDCNQYEISTYYEDTQVQSRVNVFYCQYNRLK